MGKSTDMNGIWSGMYNYDQVDMTVKFTAWLDDENGALGGSVMEPNTFVDGGPDELMAKIKGVRSGLDLAFSKVYHKDLGIRQPPLRYEGEANADFTEVRGVWRFDAPDLMRGQFRLIRMVEGMAGRLLRARAETVKP
ncbi:MAG: hypothetical protein AAGJ29_03295 [Pseudomonadota bacterium]